MPAAKRHFLQRFGVALLAILAAALAVWLAGAGAAKVAVSRLEAQAGPRLDLYALGLESELGKYDPVPAVLGQDPRLLALLADPADANLRDAANQFLEQANAFLGTSAVYVVDVTGTTLAASNWREPLSFVGRNFSYRPYVRDALASDIGRFYGIGTTSRAPGYYVARAIRRGDAVIGGAVVKVSLDRLERTWATTSEKVLVKDANGVVILASEPAWKFKTLTDLPPETLDRLRKTRHYDQVRLEPLDWQVREVNGARIVTAESRRYLALSHTLDDAGWEVTVLHDLRPVAEAKWAGALSAAALSGILALLPLYVRQRRRTRSAERQARNALARANSDLERKVEERTSALTQANAELRTEIAERQRAEQELRRAQEGLVQAAKLAALGQLSAGVAHEINQPLAALRTLSDNAAVFLERRQDRQVAGNLAMIARLTERIASITGQLRNFARKSGNESSAVSLRASIDAVLTLLRERLRREGVEVAVDLRPPGLAVWCDATRLEQILVNLLANAIDATQGSADRHLQVTGRMADGRVRIEVADTGPGLPPDVMARLFEPFFTTKASGAGLGLGLAISAGIAQDFGGALTAANRPEGGAVFTLELPTVDAPVTEMEATNGR